MNLLIAHGQRIVFIIFGIGIKFIVLCRKKELLPLQLQQLNSSHETVVGKCFLIHVASVTLKH